MFLPSLCQALPGVLNKCLDFLSEHSGKSLLQMYGLMRKSKIQPLTPLQSRIFNISRLLLFRHRLPDPISVSIHINVVKLCRDKDQNHDEIDDQQIRVSAMVLGFVVFAVDEECCYAAHLDGHLHHVLLCVNKREKQSGTDIV